MGGPRARDAAARRPVIAALAGQALEFYDFLLYGSAAALVFGPLFFPSENRGAATAAALATVSVGFLVRPVGAVLFGHVGDRYGRRPALLASLALMGAATTAIGLLPTHGSVGAWAPVTLVLLRALQGVSLGGEWGGAVLLAVEHAPSGRRALFGSLPQLGSPIGLLMSTGVLLALQATLSDGDFQTWGWRVPFLLAGAFALVGLWARRRLVESPEYEAAAVRQPRPGRPAADVWRQHRRPLLAGMLASLLTTAGYYLVTTFTVGYVVNELDARPWVGLVGLVVTAVVQAVLLPVYGLWAASRSPRSLMCCSCLAAAAWSFPLYALVGTGEPVLVWTGQAIAMVFLSGVWALLPVLLAEQFPPLHRYTGASLAFQSASAVAGLAPAAAGYLTAGSDGAPHAAATLLAVAALASAVGSWLCRPPGSMRVEGPGEPSGRSATAFVPEQVAPGRAPTARSGHATGQPPPAP